MAAAGAASAPAQVRAPHSDIGAHRYCAARRMSPIASTPATPPLLASRAAPSPWSSARGLVARLDPQAQARLLLLSALPWLAAWLLWQLPLQMPAFAPALPLALDAWLGTQLGSRWGLLGLLAVALAASSYVTVCAWLGLSRGLQRLRHEADVQADEHARAQRDAAAGQAAACVEAQAALRLHHTELRAAVGELARRTVALCGMLDADMRDAERVGVDLEAIQDEERYALQLMSALRARLLSLAQHCQALTDAAAAAAPSQLDGALAAPDEPGAGVGADIAQCHQLSERVGGAERLNERRIESMRLSTDRLQCRAERALLEGQQLMVLTRQMQSSLSAAQQRQEQLAQHAAALTALASGAVPGPNA